MTAKIIRQTFDNLNSRPETTKIPPRIYAIVAKRKYAPIAKNGKALLGGRCPVGR